MAFSPLDIKSSSSYTYIFSPRNWESQTITYKENLLSNTHRRHHKGEHATILWCIIKRVLRFASFLYKKMCQILEYLVKQAKKKKKTKTGINRSNLRGKNIFFFLLIFLSPLIMHIDDIETVTETRTMAPWILSECKAFTVKCIKIRLLVDTKGESIIHHGIIFRQWVRNSVPIFTRR